MRSLALAFSLSSSLIACGTTESPETTSEVDLEPVIAVLQPEPGSGAPELRVLGSFTSPDCDAAVLGFEAIVQRLDGSSVAGATCRWTFDDGGSADGCAGTYELADGGVHGYTLEVRDPASGAVAVVTGEAFVEPPLQAAIDVQVPACGLELAFSASANATGEAHVEISPAENVVGGGLFLAASGTAQLLAAGTYEVTYEIEHERTNGPICLRRVAKSVTVAACHEHEEGCVH